MEGFVFKCPGKQSAVSRWVRLDGFAKSRVGGRDEVWVILSRSVHDLVVKTKCVIVTVDGTSYTVGAVLVKSSL